MPSPEDRPDGFLEDLSKACRLMSREIQALAERLADLATAFDSLGAKEDQAPGSPARMAAELRDHADMCLSQAVRHLQALMRIRAQTSHSVDLMVESIVMEKGDGGACLDLIETYYERTKDPTEGQGTVIPCTFPDAFFWETVRRVKAIPDLAEKYPEHLRYAAAHFQGLPMMVSHHIDITPEFKRLASLLRVGASHPLDVSPRRKRGGVTPAMSYLEPLIWRMHNLWELMAEENGANPQGFTDTMISNVWSTDFNAKTPEPQIEVLRKLAGLPALSKSTALAWTREVIVPFILVEVDGNPGGAKEPFIRNIWNHRAVKSLPTFRSRLESAVSDFLARYSRDD